MRTTDNNKTGIVPGDEETAQSMLTRFITIITILTKANSVLSLYPLSRRHPT